MNDNENSVRATVYLQVQPEYKRWYGTANRDTADAIDGAKVVGSTQNKSQKPKPGTVEVKITIEVPKGAFLPLRPEAVVVVPESMTQPHPVEVEALDANEEDTL
ncbi:hypothetical protein ACF1AJ_20550 [Leifsonia sp. NPDC014704]|uniref:hypothetical protein n=1 Tax=Leifsonia sp. NPDC014704 TaxID=3364123 RepID=UPI0036F4AC37